MLVIPPKEIIKLRSSEGQSINLDVVEVGRIFGGLVQPSSTPQKLILENYWHAKINLKFKSLDGNKKQNWRMKEFTS